MGRASTVVIYSTTDFVEARASEQPAERRCDSELLRVCRGQLFPKRLTEGLPVIYNRRNVWTTGCGEQKTGKYHSVHAACCENLFQLFRPVNDNPQTAAVCTAQHNESPVAGYIVIRDRDGLAENVFVGE